MSKDPKAPFGYCMDGVTPKKSAGGRPPGAKNRPAVKLVKKPPTTATLRATIRLREAALKMAKNVLRTRLRKELDALGE